MEGLRSIVAFPGIAYTTNAMVPSGYYIALGESHEPIACGRLGVVPIPDLTRALVLSPDDGADLERQVRLRNAEG